jgi:uncharacterized protein (TIGR03086 family)
LPVVSDDDDINLLEGILDKTGDVIGLVGDDQWQLPTPCPDYDVDALVNHMVGWVRAFESGSNGRQYQGDPGAYRRGADPAADFRTSAAGLVTGWRTLGFDRDVPVSTGSSPGPMVMNMTLMEYLTHGWDLATATGQPVPYTDTEGAKVLQRAEQTLPPQYRGPDMPFGVEVPIAASAPAVDRLIAFMGRDPGVHPTD